MYSTDRGPKNALSKISYFVRPKEQGCSKDEVIASKCRLSLGTMGSLRPLSTAPGLNCRRSSRKLIRKLCLDRYCLPRFSNTDLIDDKIKNFALLQPTFRNLNIKFLPSDAERIMQNQRGAALRLLYQIKMVLDRIAMIQRGNLPEEHQHSNLIVKDPHHLTHSLRLQKPVYDEQYSRFFVSRLRAQCSLATQERREAR